jgi:hypothetical protein
MEKSLDGPLPKWCPAVALSHQDGRHSAVALLLKAALIQVSDYRLLGASGYTCIQNRIIHKHVCVDYIPLKLSIVTYAASPESRGHSRTPWLYIDVKLLPKFHCTLDS